MTKRPQKGRAAAVRPISRNPTARPRAGQAKRAQPRAAARPRPGLLSRLRPRTLLRAGCAVVVLGTSLWAWQSGYAARQGDRLLEGLYGLSAELGLRIANVHVVGRHHTASEEILATLAVTQGGPLLAFDPHAARQRLEALPWVESAAVERRLPDLIHVTLRERQPLALWQLEGRLQVIDAAGAVILGAEAAEFGELPLVVGPGADLEAAALLAILDTAPELAGEVEAAVRVGERRWNLRLRPGIEVRLPEEGALEAWQTLARLDQENGLLSRDVVVIDLRQPDRLVVRPSPGVVVEPPVPPVAGEDT